MGAFGDEKRHDGMLFILRHNGSNFRHKIGVSLIGVLRI